MIIGISGTIGSGKDTVASMIAESSQRPWQVKKFAGKLKQIVALLTGCKVEDLESDDFKNSTLPGEWDIDGKSQTYRGLLQKLGTELLRDGVHKDVHINALYADYVLEDYQHFTNLKEIGTGLKEITTSQRFPFWLLTDLRFENEFESIKDRGGFNIRIERLLSFDNWAKQLNIPIAHFNDDSKITKTHFILSLQNIDYHNPEFFKKHLHASETGLNDYASDSKFDVVLLNDGTLAELKSKIKSLVALYLL